MLSRVTALCPRSWNCPARHVFRWCTSKDQTGRNPGSTVKSKTEWPPWSDASVLAACFDFKLDLLGHNTIRGAAGAAILNAELLVKQQLLKARS